MQMDDPQHKPMITVSQGIHIVVDKEFFPGDKAMIIPKTDDGRVLFAVPWHNKVVIGTTDTALNEIVPLPWINAAPARLLRVHDPPTEMATFEFAP